ncbi:MAG TPA: PAS domain-containing protein [Anaeromyxobacter sp.]|nr:PAS domain-containing protein [Anaeromyxobacter sp.]
MAGSNESPVRTRSGKWPKPYSRSQRLKLDREVCQARRARGTPCGCRCDTHVQWGFEVESYVLRWLPVEELTRNSMGSPPRAMGPGEGKIADRPSQFEDQSAARPGPDALSIEGRPSRSLERPPRPAKPSSASFLPIPILLALMTLAGLAFGPSVYYDPAWLILLGNMLGVTAVGLVVSYVALRNYQATGRLQVLLLGCGVLTFGIGGAIAALVRSMSDGANLNVTIYNTSALLGGSCHLAAAFFLLTGVSPEAESKRRRFWLLLGYGGSALILLVLSGASFLGAVPPFFVQGVGPTVLRQGVLGTADLLFLFSFIIFLGSYLRTRDAFLYWYACALVLTCISLTAFLVEHSVGSPVGWVGRLSQYLGGAYFLVSLIKAARKAESRGTSLDMVLTDSLSGAEERFRALAENSPDAIFRFDRQLNLLYVNAAGQRLFRRRPGALIGRPMGDLGLPAPQAEVLRGAVRRVFDTGGQVQVEERFSVGGGARFVEARCVAERGSEGEVVNVLMVTRDITDRKRADEEVKRTLESIGDGFFAVDAQWRFVYVNEVAERVLGIRRDAVLGRSHWEVFPLTVGTQLEAQYRRAAAGEVRDFENYFEPWARWFHNRCFPREGGGMSVYFEDITERKRAEDERERLVGELREAQGRVAADLDGMTQLQKVGSLFLREGSLEPVLTEIVDAAIAISGADFGNIQILDARSGDLRLAAQRGFPGWWLDHWKTAPRGRGSCGTALERGERVIVEDVEQSPIFVGTPNLEIQRRAGIRAVQSTPLMSRSGDPLGMVSTHYRKPGRPDERALRLLDLLARQTADIIERARAEEAMRSANARLLEADQRKNEFLAVLSHELRNPLAPIANSLYVLERAGGGGGEAERAKRIIGRQVSQLSSLIDDLLDVTRITRNKVQLSKARLELNEVVRSAVEDNRSSFERADVRLELSLAPGPVQVVADRTRIAQIVGNLLQNSAKFTSSGGRTRVSVAAEGSEAIVRVVDDGIGIAGETLARLFQPFMQADQTLDRSKGGLGLGLALVKGLVELHGGSVSAHSQGIGKGAELVVRLPLDTGAAVEQAATRVRAPGARRRVLVIEDNIDAADSLRQALELSNHEVQVAYSGPEGIAKVRESRPDVVLCDIGLPGMSGLDVARVLRADPGSRVPLLVALSGYALPEDLQRAHEAGFDRHLTKPPSMEKLEELLAEMPGTSHARSS